MRTLILYSLALCLLTPLNSAFQFNGTLTPDTLQKWDFSNDATSMMKVNRAVQSIDSNAFDAYTSLTGLYMNHTPVSTILPNVFKGLTSLRNYA